ncbi:MAG: RecQ family ATP-dependent DNA helicase, partial [Bacteroidales bacterium]|nr:RecQ family ATP-dependent DNA helicase [Bacteroidales bacterium]
ALMKDQVENLKKRGIPALAIYSGMTYHEIDVTLDNAIYGGYKFLYVSPERLHTELFQARLAKMRVNYLVVDEAHCISQWGYDFRPDYLTISDIRKILDENSDSGSRIPVIALTATATADVAKDIMLHLNFSEENLIISGFERPNLSYSVRKAENKLGQLLKVCNGVPGCGVVYVSRRKRAEELALFLQSQGISAAAYHAGMPRQVRTAAQDEWKSDKIRVMVATNAFGMGIDKPDVRFVCHYDLPSSPEAYFQEAGRAGRDGEKAYALLIWNSTDLTRLKNMIHTTYPSLDYIKEIYQKVFQYLGLAYEDGKEKSYKFSIEEFSKQYNLQPTMAYYAIKYIEMSGYWSLTEELEIPPKICMLASREELYHLQVSSIEDDNFLKVLMRLYTGLFSGYITIDEEEIARAGRYSVLSVEAKLKKLDAKRVIRYIPKVKSPILHLVNERLYEANLRLPKVEYDDRVNRSQKRNAAMINYVTTADRCRSQMLLEYFGQTASAPCGCCDYCLKKNR